MSTRMKPSDIPAAMRKHLPKKRHKYGARKTVVDGITFHSAKEAKRYGELKVLEKTGKISQLELQPKFALHADGGTEVGKYIADFHYYEFDVGYVIEDVKGMKTPLYRWKKKHVEAEYGITIVEV